MDLEAHGISHRYGDLEVLSELSFRVPTGSVTVVVGPSGCGKSTLLRILGGLGKPSAGSVSMLGTPSSSCLNPVTFVFQDFALLPWRTVAGNVALPLEGHRLDREQRRDRVAAALASSGLSDFAEAFPRQLSGGMQQRVGIARALAVRPAVMLMDEPLSALDSQTRHLLRDELRVLWSELAVTTVLVTHDLTEAAILADQVLVLSRRPGRLRALVPVELPREQRSGAPGFLVDLEARLWGLLRDEAAQADRELA